MSPHPSRLRSAGVALAAAAVVTAAVAVESHFVAAKHMTTVVGFTLLAATWLLVWRYDDATVARHGLSFGGIVFPGPIDVGRLTGSTLRALGWAGGLAVIAFVPYYFGWRLWWRPHAPFHFAVNMSDAANQIAGQFLLIALPEEAFYRGYLQTRLEEAMPWRVKILGAAVGPGVVLASAVFALVHVATLPDPARLAVFFPSLVFGWLRARTGGIGASLAFHALCNLWSAALGSGYGVY